MVVADLHVHTTTSDGQLHLADLPAAARAADLEAVAVTDHDRFHPDLDPVERRDGVTLVSGIELRVEADDQRVDLLGYGVSPTAALREECRRLQTDRVERGRAIVECVEDRLSISLPVEVRPGIGRPHVARAVAAATEHDVAWVFEHLIGDDGPCYVPRPLPSFERGVEILANSCRLVGLAHPLRYPDPDAALALCATLDAVERWYPYDAAADDTAADDAPVDRAIERYGLVPTGGSDAHDDRLGRAGLDSDAYRDFKTSLSAEK